MSDKMTQHEWDLAHDDASRLHTALTGFDDNGQPAAAQADAGQGEAVGLAANLDHVSTQWAQLHQELSAALRLDFEPNEDIERYTEAIAALREQVATLTAERDAVRQEVADLEIAASRSDLDINYLKAVVHLPTIQSKWESIFARYETSDDNCPLCGNAQDEPHKLDCTMLTIIALVDGDL